MRMPVISPLTRTALIASVLLPLIALFRLGEDRNWDLGNYHLYNPHAWLNGRYGFDVAVAQLQTWHNPLLDVPLYLLVRADVHGLLISAWLALPTMLALLAGTWVLTALRDRPLAHWEVLLFACIAGTGAALYPTIGSSMNDAVVAAGIVLSLALVCRPNSDWKAWVFAGLLAGATAGLKLTAMLYCIGLASAALVGGPLAGLPKRVIALAVGGAVGFLLTYGAWGLHLWQAHGNPVFPYFNQVFLSPDAPPEGFADARFRPASILDGLLAPIRMLRTNNAFSELPARAPLLLAGMLSIAWLSWRLRDASPSVKRSFRMVAAVFLVSFVIWTMQYGILRYTTPLEVLAAALLMTALASLPRHFHAVIAASVGIAIIAFTVHPDWGRRPFSRHFLVADWPSLPAHSMVLTRGDYPLAYFVLGLPGNTPVLAIQNNLMDPNRCYGLQQQVEARIRSHAGSLWLLEPGRVPSETKRDYGLVGKGACISIRSSFGPLQLCPMARTEVPIQCPLPQR